MTDQERTELIQGKIFNNLSNEEQNRFTHLMETDADFRKEFDLYQQVKQNLDDKEAIILRKKLTTIYAEVYGTKKEHKTIKFMKKNWYSVAAAVALLFLAGTYLFMGTSSKDWSKELYNTYYSQDEVYVNTRSKASLDVDVLHHGMELLEKKDFSAALEEFNKLPHSVTANYYSGVANMELNNHEVAIFKFDYVINDYLNLFYDQAQWYKGLCLVKLNQKNEAIDVFNQIVNSDSYFKDKAQQIVADLEKK